MKSFKQYLEEGFLKEDFVKDVKTIRAQWDEFSRTGKLPSGVSSIKSEPSTYLGQDINGQFTPSGPRIKILSQALHTRPATATIGVTRQGTVDVLDPGERVTSYQKARVKKTPPGLMRGLRQKIDLTMAAQKTRGTGIHELAHNLQDERQTEAELRKYVRKRGELPPPDWTRRLGGNMEKRTTPKRESRGAKQNRTKDAWKRPFTFTQPAPLITDTERYTEYRNRDIEVHSRSVEYADNLYNGDYQRSVQAQMRRNPTANIESILTQHRNNVIRRTNHRETWMDPRNNKKYTSSTKNLKIIPSRMGLVVADIEKEMDLTSPEKIKAFRDRKLSPKTFNSKFPKSFNQPKPMTGIEKAVVVGNNVRKMVGIRTITPARAIKGLKTFNKAGAVLAAGTAASAIIGDQLNRHVFAPRGGVSKWFDRNVSDPIFGRRQAVLGESYDTYKEHIRSVLLEKYSKM